jgi:L-ribulose-5-phosphate 3-epimerase
VNNLIGIMQGRLSAPSPAGPQVFPAATWRGEFATARELDFDTIEWLVEAESLANNPLLSPSGRVDLKQVETKNDVRAASVCAHCVLQWRPFDAGGAERLENFLTVIAAAGAAGIERIIVPVLEEASTARAGSLERAAETFCPSVHAAEQAGVDLAFEMDCPAEDCRKFIALLDSPRARLCYDTGNATALGRDIVAEINLLLPLVAEIHVKDRRLGGASQPLGRGDTRFAPFIEKIAEHAWAGQFVLETPVLDDPVGQARQNLALLREFLT